MYGVADIYYSSNSTPKGNLNTLYSGSEAPSRFGMKGTEDLGGGMSANFQLEAGVNLNDGTSGQGGILFGRQAKIALSDEWGTLSAGRQYNPFFYDIYYIDPMAAGMAGAAFNLFANYGFWTNNSVITTTRNINGFTGSAIVGFGGLAGNASGNRQYGLSGNYVSGPLLMLADYFVVNDVTGNSSEQTAMTGLSVDFKLFKSYLAYSVNKSSGTAFHQNNSDALIGFSVPFSVHTLMASYIVQTDKSGSEVSLSARQWALAYTYRLSKSSDIFISWARINSDASNPVPFTTISGVGTRESQLGLHHTF